MTIGSLEANAMHMVFWPIKRLSIAFALTNLLYMIALGVFAARVVSAEQLSVGAEVQSQRVYVGQPFVLQVVVRGDKAAEVELEKLEDFTVSSLGSSENESHSITIINGRVTKLERSEMVHSFQLVAKRSGSLAISPIRVTSNGERAYTRAIAIQAVEPREADEDFALEMSISEHEIYIGQVVRLNVTWYIGEDVQQYSFNMPVLDNDHFELIERNVQPIDPKLASRFIELDINGMPVLAERHAAMYNGQKVLAVSFDLLLIAKKEGKFKLPASSVYSQIAKAAPFNRDRFGGFSADDFFQDRMGHWLQASRGETVAVSSNSPEVSVKKLPAEGRPANFSGLVGQYTLSASAEPTRVRVGDPITFRLTVAADTYAGNVEMPQLSEIRGFSENFKIPAERAAGEFEQSKVHFTQTLRVRHADVTRIPPVSLSYFDVEKESYVVTSSQAIPLSVEHAEIVTAEDAEGPQIKTSSETEEIEETKSGLRHNYAGQSLLKNEVGALNSLLLSPIMLFLICVPPLLLLGVCGLLVTKQRRLNYGERLEAKRAYSLFSSAVKQLNASATEPPSEVLKELLKEIRRYNIRRFNLQSGTVSGVDIFQELSNRSVKTKLAERMAELLAACEAEGYSGASISRERVQQVIEESKVVVAEIEKSV